MGQVGVNFGLGHIGWMPPVVKEYEPLHPMAIGLFGSSAVVAGAQGFAKTVQEFRLPDSLRGIAWMANRYTRSAGYGTSLLHGLLPLFEGRERLSFALPQSQAHFMNMKIQSFPSPFGGVS